MIFVFFMDFFNIVILNLKKNLSCCLLSLGKNKNFRIIDNK